MRAYAVLYVVYGEDGNVDHSGFLNHEISGVIVDMDLVVNDCPRRYFVSGIVDAWQKTGIQLYHGPSEG